MKKERITVRIPVKRHLKNFVKAITSPDGDLVSINANSDFGLVFFSLLEVTHGHQPQINPSDFFIEVEFPVRDKLGKTYDCRHIGPTISQKNIDRFNRFLDTLLRKELFDRLDLIKERGENKRKSGKIKFEIESFLDKYDIDPEDLSYETLKKDYQRRNKRGSSIMKKAV